MNDKEYEKKLELSFNVCLDELTNPSPNWEEKIEELKFTIDPKTMKIIDHIDFEFDLSGNKDNINVDIKNHTYIFKRSIFYKKFSRSSDNRIKSALKDFYHKKNFDVDLIQIRNKVWLLRISWVNTEIKNPNIVVRMPFRNFNSKFKI